MADFRFTGLKELNETLDKLPAQLAANVLRGALRRGMQQIQPYAAQLAPKSIGLLAFGLKIGSRIDRGTGRVMAYLKTTGPHAYLAGWMEFGTAPHLISVQEEEKNVNWRRSVRLGRLVRESMSTINRHSLVIGRTFVGPVVKHPGIVPYGNKALRGPHSFMRPALDAKAQEAVRAAAEYMKLRLATKHGYKTADIRLGGDE